MIKILLLIIVVLIALRAVPAHEQAALANREL